ncbi:MAG: redox-regulated ATPase YchF [Candidatus Micrarchaeaceae archaeon]
MDKMLVGIIGAPNKGKSTLFSALTQIKVQIADYPFTTIDPNKGVAYVTVTCVEKELGVKCNARNSLCKEGIRMIPVNIMDVAGLVEGAHEGKGMGNQFLNNLSTADAFMLVVDASGRTDSSGNPCDGCNPEDDIEMVVKELDEWLAGIVKKHMPSISGSKNGVDALHEVLAGLKIRKEDIEKAIDSCYLSSSNINWSEEDILDFSKKLLEISKPIEIIANKADSNDAEKNIERLKSKYKNVYECSAAIELALQKAVEQHIIDYIPGNRTFNVLGNANEEQKKALEYMLDYINKKEYGTGTQHALNSLVFDVLENIVVYPVEDENKYSDHMGNILPDALLIKKGLTALEMAEMIHTDIAKHMLYAIDAKKKIRIGKDYKLKNNDVIKVVSTA